MFISFFHNYSYSGNEKRQGSQTSPSELFVHKTVQTSVIWDCTAGTKRKMLFASITQ